MRRRLARRAAFVGAPVQWARGAAPPHPLRECLTDLFLARWIVALPLASGPARFPRTVTTDRSGVSLPPALHERLVLALMRVALGDPWLERLTPFRPTVEYQLGIVAETLRVRVSFATSDLVFLTPAGRPLGLKAGFECVAAEMEVIAREALERTRV